GSGSATTRLVPHALLRRRSVPPFSCIFFFLTDPAPAELYTLSYTTLFRSAALRVRRPRPDPDGSRPMKQALRTGLIVVAAIVATDRKSTRLNSSHVEISYAVFCLKKKKNTTIRTGWKTCSTRDGSAPYAGS